MSAALGFGFCAALSDFTNLFELIADPPTDGRRRGLAGLLDGLAGALAAPSATAARESMVGERSERCRRRDGDQYGHARALHHVDQRVAHSVLRAAATP